MVSVQATFIHANVRFEFGPLKWLVATPQFHHWHHAAEREAIDKNFAVHLPVLDAMFGTMYLPGRWPGRTASAPVRGCRPATFGSSPGRFAGAERLDRGRRAVQFVVLYSA